MRQRPITDVMSGNVAFTLHERDFKSQKSVLYKADQRICMVNGVDLVGYFRVDTGWLIITDCESPFEEIVFFSLFSEDMTLLETDRLGGAYMPGVVSDINRVTKDTFSIKFPSSRNEIFIKLYPKKTELFKHTTKMLHFDTKVGPAWK